MNNNLLIAMCEKIEEAYWERYIDDYNEHGANDSVTRKSWEDYEVANDVTRQIFSAMENSIEQGSPLDRLYEDLYELIMDVNENEIAEHIKRMTLAKWSYGWRTRATEALRKIQMRESDENNHSYKALHNSRERIESEENEQEDRVFGE